MNLLLLGLSHHTASVAARERIAAAVGDVSAWLGRARERRDVAAETLVLATCHRLEIYVATPDVDMARLALAPALAMTGPVEREASSYERTGLDVVTHLGRVACGLDSLIVGEAEIAGQIRRAAAVAREAGTMGPYLEAAVAGALAASGRSKAETQIGRGVMSAASAAVAMAEGLLGSLRDRTILVVGAGQAGRLALARAARGPHGRLHVASRSERHAREAAEASGAHAHALAEVPSLLRDVDVVIAAVQAAGTLVTRDHGRDALAARPGRPLLAIDLSVPRVMAADLGTVPGIRVCSVDDLGDVVRQSTRRRAREIPLVEAIIGDEARRAWRRVVARQRRAAALGR
jgi:glutamyl-tRNA reductase